jgi:Do/DeqQ family serine protease
VTYPRIDIIGIGRRLSRRRLERTLLIATAFTLPVAAWGVGSTQLHDAFASNTPAAVGAAAPVGTAAPLSYAPVVDAVMPAVVTIRAEQRVAASAQALPFAGDPLFREFFGNRLPRGGEQGAQPRQGLGSGVIVSADGYILTNHHVIDEADRVRVELSDRRTFTAKVVGSDAPSDLAVLKIDASRLPFVRLGNSDDVRVGDVVLAVGNPMGVGQTVTMGIVSAKGRATGLGDGSFEDFIQTDAPINRGNSGGALVSTRGELVGINSQILSPSGGNIGIGFSIPANMAKHVMDALVKDGQVHRGMLGVTVQSLTADLATSLGLDAARGALVSSVTDDGPADEAGIERGDVLVAIDGNPIDDSNELRNRIAATKPGGSVNLTVIRDGKERALTATLDELPSTRAAAQSEGEDPQAGALGLQVQPVPPDRARALGLEEGDGLLVTAVRPGSPASDAGFQNGDVIEEVNRQPVTGVETVRDAVDDADGRPVLVLIRRGEQPLYLTVSAPKA